jgi:hypothetical protein
VFIGDLDVSESIYRLLKVAREAAGAGRVWITAAAGGGRWLRCAYALGEDGATRA